MKLGKIKIEYFKEPQEIIITANSDGLKYLSEVCKRIIGKKGPSAHWHLSVDMGSLEFGSIDTRICFIEENEPKQRKRINPKREKGGVMKSDLA